jgi:lysophospholipase L1-like esterase
VIAFLGLTEAALRVLHLPAAKPSPSPIEFQQIPQPALVGDRSGSGLELRICNDCQNPLTLPKPPGLFRVFSFGGSATRGAGFPHHGSFSRWLERMLRAAYPERRAEVVNLGRVGYCSEQVKELVREVLAKGEPDLLVIYAGHNEFLDVKAREVLARQNAHRPLTALSAWLDRRLATARLARELLHPRSPAKFDPRLLFGFHHVRLTPEQIDAGLLRYENNLTEIAGLARRRNVPVVFCTLLGDPAYGVFSGAFTGPEWAAEQQKHLFFQAAGWARLVRWDKAEQALRQMTQPRSRHQLLRVYEAGGVRGIDRLPPRTRRELRQTAGQVVREIQKQTKLEINDLFALALAYRLLGDEARLRQALAELDRAIAGRPERADQLGWRLVRTQFDDAARFQQAFDNYRHADELLITAHWKVNDIVRRVAASQHVLLADVERALPDWRDPTPERYLLDYCHPNIEGAFEIARIVFEAATAARVLPLPAPAVDFRRDLLTPDLTYLRATAHDFPDRDRYLGLDWRVCYVYAQPWSDDPDYRRWSAEDARGELDRKLVEAFADNRRWFER